MAWKGDRCTIRIVLSKRCFSMNSFSLSQLKTRSCHQNPGCWRTKNVQRCLALAVAYIQLYLRHCQCAWAVINAVGCWISVEWYSVCVYKRCRKRRYWVGEHAGEVKEKHRNGVVYLPHCKVRQSRALRVHPWGPGGPSVPVLRLNHPANTHRQLAFRDAVTSGLSLDRLRSTAQMHTHARLHTHIQKQEPDVNITDIRGKCHQPWITSCSFRG